MPRKTIDEMSLPFYERSPLPETPWSIPDWLTNPGTQDAPVQGDITPPEMPQNSDKPINPIVKKALMAKMATPPAETKSPAIDQDALAQQQYEAGKVNPWLAFASGIGQTLQGKSPDLSWQDRQNQLVYDETLGKLALSKASAEKKRQFEEEMKFKNRSLEEQIAARKELAQMAAQSKKDELMRKNMPEERVKNLSGQDKARFDNALMAIKGLDDMAKALDAGQNTFSVVGDNDYTAAERRATEAYGRMQSGGAINKEEEKRFSQTLPGVSDSKDIQRNKILKQRDEMISRLKTLGFSPDQVGVAPNANFSYGAQKQNKPKQVIQNGHTYTLNESTGEYE